VCGPAFAVKLEQATTNAYYLWVDDFEPPAYLADSGRQATAPLTKRIFPGYSSKEADLQKRLGRRFRSRVYLSNTTSWSMMETMALQRQTAGAFFTRAAPWCYLEVVAMYLHIAVLHSHFLIECFRIGRILPLKRA
jgi:hypothetical protein